MGRHATVTVNRPREGVERIWQKSEYRPEYIDAADADVRFEDAPGDRGTEIHVEVDPPRGGKVGEAVMKLTGKEPLAKVKDDLRRFKQHVETGVIAQSDGTPEGERAERKLGQRPAHPLSDGEVQEVQA